MRVNQVENIQKDDYVDITSYAPLFPWPISNQGSSNV